MSAVICKQIKKKQLGNESWFQTHPSKIAAEIGAYILNLGSDHKDFCARIKSNI